MEPADKLPRIAPMVEEHLATALMFKSEHLEHLKALPTDDFTEMVITEMSVLAHFIKALATQVDFLAELANR
jgi:hypothetical protein